MAWKIIRRAAMMMRSRAPAKRMTMPGVQKPHCEPPLATNAAFHANRAFVGLVVGAFTIGWSTFAFAAGRLVHRIGERLPSVIGIIVHILGLLFFMVAFEHGLGWVIAAALIAGAGMGLLSPALTVVVQNSVPVARMGSATTSQQFIRQIAAALGVSAFVLAATVGGFRLGLILMIAVSAGTFACVLALPAHSLHDAKQDSQLRKYGKKQKSRPRRHAGAPKQETVSERKQRISQSAHCPSGRRNPVATPYLAGRRDEARSASWGKSQERLSLCRKKRRSVF